MPFKFFKIVINLGHSYIFSFTKLINVVLFLKIHVYKAIRNSRVLSLVINPSKIRPWILLKLDRRNCDRRGTICQQPTCFLLVTHSGQNLVVVACFLLFSA